MSSAAGALVGVEHLGAARILPEPHAVDDRLRQGRRIVQAEIEALAGDRVDHVRGVAQQRDAGPPRRSARRRTTADRRAAWSRTRSARVAGRSGARARPEDPRDPIPSRPGTLSVRSVQTMDERCRTVPSLNLRLQRQDREGPGGQKMFDRRGPRGRAHARWWRRCRIGGKARKSSRCRPVRAGASARHRRPPATPPARLAARELHVDVRRIGIAKPVDALESQARRRQTGRPRPARRSGPRP